MSAKTIFVFCAQALFIQLALGQCLNNYAPRIAGCGSQGIALPGLGAPCGGLAYGAGLGYGSGLAYGSGFGSGISALDIIPTTGGALPVSSASPVAPNGLSVSSENTYEGCLQAIGELPFLSAVALEGVLPTAGAGVVNYGCGNGVTAITSGGAGSGYGIGGVNAYGPGAIGIGGVGGLAGTGSGIGCGGIPNYGIRAPCGCGGY